MVTDKPVASVSSDSDQVVNHIVQRVISRAQNLRGLVKIS